MDIYTIILNVLSLLIIAFAIAVALFICFWSIIKIAIVSGKWLLKHTFVGNVISCIRNKWNRWWDKHRVRVISLLDFYSEIILDPLFYGWVLYSLVKRMEYISTTYPQYSFWQGLNLDMETDMNFYLITRRAEFHGLCPWVNEKAAI